MSGVRRIPLWPLAVAFVAVPLIEIYAILAVGRAIGAPWTIALLVLDSIVGAWLIKREGRRAWAALGEALGSGAMPARELADGALILIGGTLMLTPGFVTDAVGMLMIIPFTRPLARAVLTRFVARRLPAAVIVGQMPMGGHTTTRPGPSPQGDVIRGEVVDD
ncbi:MAG: FxsA family protein [Nocardioides sp.]